MILRINGTIEIAHNLPKYEGKCKNLHGHRIEYLVSFEGDIQEDGMVEDFKELDNIIQIVANRFDHTYLNDFFENPTLEIFAKSFLNSLNQEYERIKRTRKRGRFVKLEMWETSKYGVVVSDE